MHTRTVLLVLFLGATMLVRAGLEPAPGGESITAEELRAHVNVLASERMSGRLVGTEGNQRAAEFIAGRFDELGLAAVGDDGGYLRRFDLLTATLGSQGNRATETRLVATVGDVARVGEIGVDHHPERYSGSGRARGSVVFVGFGIVAPDIGHDDYRDVDVTGRVVVVLDHEPGEHDANSPFDGPLATEHARAVRKALEAQRRGAAAVLVVADVHNHASRPSIGSSLSATWPTGTRRVPRYQLGAWTGALRIPAFRISERLAQQLVGEPGESLDAITRRAETPGGMVPMVRSDVDVEVATSIRRESVAAQNVVGLVEGSDPTLRDEWIIVCAHLDHEGTTTRGLHPGADDDASGIAGMLEVAEAFAEAGRAGLHPRRSVLFAAWNAEERGLLGAWAYTERPLVPLSQTVAVLNLDMIGRHEEVPEAAGARFRGLSAQTAESNRNAVNLIGSSYSGDLRAEAEAANDLSDLLLRFRYDDNASNLLRRSDHWPFLFHGVPALFIHTGLHPDYHTVRDTPDKLDYDKMARIAGLVHQLSWNLAEADTRPRMDGRTTP